MQQHSVLLVCAHAYLKGFVFERCLAKNVIKIILTENINAVYCKKINKMMENIKENDLHLPVRNPESIGLVLKNTVNEIAGGISESEFQQTLSTLKNRSSIAKSLYSMQVADIINDNQQNIDKMYSESGIDAKYNDITKLIQDSPSKSDLVAWRPITGDCDMQLAAYRKKSLVNTKIELQKLVEEERSRRILMKNSLDLKRSKIESLLKSVESAKTKLSRNSDI